jgi:peptidoglycan hydrolase-like protein with peptidoglycan-binding domain
MRFLSVLLGVCLAALLAGAPAASKKKTATTKKSSSKKTSSSKKKKSSKRRPATTWRNRQLHPTPDRYLDIQRALASKGYLKTEPTGVWNDDSVEALRAFQRDQNLEPSGKLDSLSLIALGLGPKYETSKMPAAPPQPARP